jgi:hypothetical protein
MPSGLYEAFRPHKSCLGHSRPMRPGEIRITSEKGVELARAAVAEKPAARFMIRHRTRVVKRHPEGDW